MIGLIAPQTIERSAVFHVLPGYRVADTPGVIFEVLPAAQNRQLESSEVEVEAEAVFVLRASDVGSERKLIAAMGVEQVHGREGGPALSHPRIAQVHLERRLR